MFFEGDRIKAVREMILADDEAGRRKALDKLLPIQRGDFESLFEVMNGLAVTVRLLDPPLHEFVPHFEKEQRELAAELGVSYETIKAKVEALAEVNPMLKYQKNIIDTTADKVFAERNDKVPYMIGTMIEVPRAAVTANEIAEVAEFFSFGTNDLTQMTLGFSRDDISKFLPEYLRRGILKQYPFQILDVKGVGQLIREAVFKGRRVREVRPEIDFVCLPAGLSGGGTFVTRQKYPKTRGHSPF